MSESDEQYWIRVKSVPGIFNDRNQSARDVVEQPGRNLADAKALAGLSELAPAVEVQQPQPIDAPVVEEIPTRTLEPGVYRIDAPVEIPLDSQVVAVEEPVAPAEPVQEPKKKD